MTDDRDHERHRTAQDVSGAEIRLENVTKRYPDTKAAAVDEFSMVIPAGKIVVFVGPSGCGKTTTMRMINRLIEPTSGRDHHRRPGRAAHRRRRAAPRDRLRHPAGRAVPALHGRAEHRRGAGPAQVGQEEDRRPGRRDDGPGRPRPGHVPAPAPAPALRRPAAARRGGQGAGRRPAGAADGRAVRRGRPDHPRQPAGRAAAAAERAGQDDRVRHPRLRRGREARRQDRRAGRPVDDPAVRHPGRDPGQPGQRHRRRLRRRGRLAQAAHPAAGARRRARHRRR